MKKFCLLVFSFLCSFVLSSQTRNVVTIEGQVFIDKNKNGKFDQWEKALKGIPVSNGDTVVLSNQKGKFFLEARSSTGIFPILPSGFELSGSKVFNANFFCLNDTCESGKPAFGLSRIKVKNHFKIGAIGDVQAGNRQELNYALQSVMAELTNRDDLDFTIFLGDLVNDNTDDLYLFRQMLDNLPFNSWTVKGNHDRDAVKLVHPDNYHRLFGPSNYSFNVSEVHFIVLNNVYSTGKLGYEGRFTNEQMRFVKNDLALVPENKLVVLCQHIPMAGVKNKLDMLSLFEDRSKVLILSGHTHRISRQFIAPNIMEITVGATSGNWWTGERDWQGIPAALMQDGSPRSYFVIDFNKSDYTFHYKGVGHDHAKQMTIWVSGQDTIDSYMPVLQEMEKNTVLVNVFAGSDQSNVQMKIDNGHWIVMEKVNQVDPKVIRNVVLNKQDVYPTKFSKQAALRKSSSPHIWKGKLPGSLPEGIHTINIEATEISGWKLEETRMFYFVE